MQPIYGIKILLKSGNHLFVGMDEAEAKKFIQDWMSGEFALKGIGYIGNPQMGWAVSLSEVAAIHLDAVTQQGQQSAQITGKVWGGKTSGLA